MKFISACIIGKPNAGKSTLLNQLIGQKLSIVTHKVQTTRTIITGITTIKDMQVIFYDTPGLFEPKKKLEKAMVKCAWSSLNNADIILLLIDCTQKIDPMVNKILSFFNVRDFKIIFILNKIDVLPKAGLKGTLTHEIMNIYAIKEELKEYINKNFIDANIFEVSALNGKGITELKEYLYDQAKPSTWLYEDDDITTLPMRFLAAEITREQLFLNLHQELPYNLTVFTESWEDGPKNEVIINQTILVSKQSHKAIILGKKGENIKRIGEKARREIDLMLNIKSHLYLYVKVEEKWENSPAFYEYTGLKPS